jgi:hypothetical protein
MRSRFPVKRFPVKPSSPDATQTSHGTTKTEDSVK